jgi:membrane protease YdiL (CAAX protease family)
VTTGLTIRSDEPPREIAAWLIVTGGITLLLARPALADGSAAPAVLAACYLLIGAAALSVPDATPAPGALGRLPVLILGLAAIAMVAWVVGPWPPLRLGWTGAPIGVLAAVAEEALFRRLAYGRLLRFGAGVAIVGSALAFALLHVPLYGVAVLPVDLGAGLLLSWQRWASGTWTVPAATHAAAELLAVLR